MKLARLIALALCCSVSICSLAQEERSPSRVYEAFYRVDFADVDAWNQDYWEHSVPVLEQLQNEGMLQGWSQWQHHTGGHYNIRFAIRTYDWASIGAFWEEYIDRKRASMSVDEWNAWRGLIQEHRDEIWEIGETVIPEGLEPTLVYAEKFNVEFPGLDEWNELWSDLMPGFIAAAGEDGQRVGWVRLDHDTGGPHNSKQLLLFEDWDVIDDFLFDRVIGTLSAERPEVWRRLNELFRSHDDIIWVPTTRD